jgi:hypothetical protein
MAGWQDGGQDVRKQPVGMRMAIGSLWRGGVDGDPAREEASGSEETGGVLRPARMADGRGRAPEQKQKWWVPKCRRAEMPESRNAEVPGFRARSPDPEALTPIRDPAGPERIIGDARWPCA